MPALWNQDDLVAEREKYGANDVTPGLTGWAQINGRDELEIPDKARLDGEYVKHLGPWMDLKCFLGTIGSVLMHDGVVEGGTGELNKEEEETEAHKSETAQSSAKKETIAKDTEESEKGRRKKKILITGSGSSSRLVLRRNFPTFVMYCSGFSSICVGTSFGVSIRMVRNL